MSCHPKVSAPIDSFAAAVAITTAADTRFLCSGRFVPRLSGRSRQPLDRLNLHALQREFFTTPKLFALPLPTGPESPPPISAPRQSASNNPGTRGLNPARSSRPIWSAESYRAGAPDAAIPHHRAIRPTPLSDRNDTYTLPGTPGEKTILLCFAGSVRRRREEIRSGRCARRLRGAGPAVPRAARAHNSE